MKIEKKIYETPKLTMHGTVEELTLQGGGMIVDLPQGTTVTAGDTATGTHF